MQPEPALRPGPNAHEPVDTHLALFIVDPLLLLLIFLLLQHQLLLDLACLDPEVRAQPPRYALWSSART